MTNHSVVKAVVAATYFLFIHITNICINLLTH
jgi:hypothetical protein